MSEDLKNIPESEWKDRLDPFQFEVCRNKGTERAFSGEYWDHHEDGVYQCSCCQAPLFDSSAKYDSGSGWPSFFEKNTQAEIDEEQDGSHGMVRTEVLCGKCGAHLGHLFPDGPAPTGLRYCINSVSLDFKKGN